MHLPDIESFWLRVKHKHFNIYVIIPTDNLPKIQFRREGMPEYNRVIFLITRAWSWGSFVKVGLSIKVLATS